MWKATRDKDEFIGPSAGLAKQGWIQRVIWKAIHDKDESRGLFERLSVTRMKPESFIRQGCLSVGY